MRTVLRVYTAYIRATIMKPDIAAIEKKCVLLQTVLRTLLPKPGDYAIGIDGLTLYRREGKNFPDAEGCARPHATIVFQGAESVRINGHEFTCRQCQCRMTSEDAYGTGNIAEASTEYPFLAASLALDANLLRELKKQAYDHDIRLPASRAVSVKTADTDMLDAFFRLVMLHKKPAHIPVLAPLIIYEIHYLLVTGAHRAVTGR